jgi:hypothetical protein
MISTELFIYNYQTKHKLDNTEFEDFKRNASSILDKNIKDVTEKYSQINLLPYIYVLQRLPKKDLQAFTRYVITYLVKSEMLAKYDYINIYDLMAIDIEYLIAVIISMQYYF